ncbi:MAG: hypothetical protein KAG84_07275 [Bacteroidales bacterium]|nr:hypothetical protein [Bacteroidales bacterium]
MMNLLNYKTIILIVFAAILSLASSCEKVPKQATQPTTGKLQLNFDFYNEADPMEWGNNKYTNAAGNEYSAYYVKFFITRLTIFKGGETTVLNQFHNSHYVSTAVATTLQWTIADEIENGSYDSLSFTFGFNDEDNVSFMFANQPEVNMLWPEELGGGYHAMQLDGKWRLANDTLTGFNFHLGPGQFYDTSGDITGFIDNSFVVSIPSSDFEISTGSTTNLILRMHVDKWFTSPIVYDHNTYGGSIMATQDAMEKVVMNGHDVFSIVK